MAVHREPPTCLYCGKEIEAIIDQQEDTPPQLRRIGDNFIGWDWDGHNKNCDKKKKDDDDRLLFILMA